jgi:hypothetical protein
MVIRRQRKVLQSAINANAIVSSIFPATVTERILQNIEEQANKNSVSPQKRLHSNESFANDEAEGLVTAFSTKPIADLFTHATVMFADIAGFTGTFARVVLHVAILESRVAHPSYLTTHSFQPGRVYARHRKVRSLVRSNTRWNRQRGDRVLTHFNSIDLVFTLLETVYAAFDKVAKTLKVFKVETIGRNADDSLFTVTAERKTLTSVVLWLHYGRRLLRR